MEALIVGTTKLHKIAFGVTIERPHYVTACNSAAPLAELQADGAGGGRLASSLRENQEMIFRYFRSSRK